MRRPVTIRAKRLMSCDVRTADRLPLIVVSGTEPFALRTEAS